MREAIFGRKLLRKHSIRSRREGGQTLIMVTLALVPMFGIMGLVVDLGYMHFVKEEAQTAAEVAAKAALLNLHATVGGALTACSSAVVCQSTITSCPSNITTPQNSIEVGCMYAANHGFQPGGNQSVTYQTGGSALTGTSATPPTVSGISNVSYWVTYRVTQTVPQLFSAVLGFPSGMVAARSTAVMVGANDCIYALDPAASGAVNVSGTAELSSACGLYVNSSSTTAMTCNGHGSSPAYDASEYDIVGSYGCAASAIIGTPNTGVSHISDPLASLAVPATGPYTCDYTNTVVNDGGTDPLPPGVYCGGIRVKKGTAQFTGGKYILVGGGLSTQDSNSIIDARNGVLIYNTYDSSHAFGGVSIAANSLAQMNAMTTGPYAGILYFEDRTAPNCPTVCSTTDTFTGGGNTEFTGAIYAKNATLSFSGNPSATSGSSGYAAYTMIIADQFNLVGASVINNDYSSLPGGSPLQQVAIVE